MIPNTSKYNIKLNIIITSFIRQSHLLWTVKPNLSKLDPVEVEPECQI